MRDPGDDPERTPTPADGVPVSVDVSDEALVVARVGRDMQVFGGHLRDAARVLDTLAPDARRTLLVRLRRELAEVGDSLHEHRRAIDKDRR